MNSFFTRYSKPIFKVILVVGIFLSVYILATYFLSLLAPFIAALILSAINEPVIRFLEKRTKISRKIAAVISLLFTLCVFGTLVVLGLVKIYNELINLKDNVSNYIYSTSDQLTGYFNQLTEYYKNLPDDIAHAINGNINSLAPKLEGIISSFVTYLISTITSLPKLALFMVVTLLSTYFISSDRKEINGFISKQMPTRWSKNISGIKSETFTAIFGYFKAMLMLMSVTFIIVSIGLFILNANYSLLIGLLVGLCEGIPVMGTATIMVPWITWSFITGDTRMGFGLAIIYVISMVMRQILEPKLVGDQLGLHPLVTLLAMYFGLSIFGVFGIFLGPICIIILKSIQDSGLVKIWNE